MYLVSAGRSPAGNTECNSSGEHPSRAGIAKREVYFR